MIAQILLPFLANFSILVFVVVNCGGKKKGAPASGASTGGPAPGAGSGSLDSKKQAPSKMDKPAGAAAADKDKKDGDDGNYEELAVPQ
ncbi:hypothetical protein CAEBREN_16405 [Caenorhabditis brenneri]|uniref:Uncharacterized protein n=1 Tax=Caenorhabditis brenneri TaxID=135651 RepID=G0MR47_CAEBE|nr:hypothetical protein CAEBREN_16405 [Caenorhabditis brenneri]